MSAQTFFRRMAGIIAAMLLVAQCGVLGSRHPQLSADQQVQWSKRWLQGVPCRAPCWEGMMPGTTTVAEAIDLLKKHPIVDPAMVEIIQTECAPGTPIAAVIPNSEELHWGWGIMRFNRDAPDQPASRACGQTDTSGIRKVTPDADMLAKKITRIEPHFGSAANPKDPMQTIPISFRLAEVIAAYGEPSHIVAAKDQQSDSFWINVIYESQGFVLKTDIRRTQLVVTKDLSFDQVVFSDDPIHDGLKGEPEAMLVPWQGLQDFDFYCRLTRSGEPCGASPITSTEPTIVVASPTGRIAFEASDDICVINADGSGRRCLKTQASRVGRNPAWSPDGRRLAFAAYGNIFVINADGSGERALTSSLSDHFPSWSPDGRRIAFARNGKGIYLIDADGTNETPLTADTKEEAANLAWSPDGNRIAYESRREWHLQRVNNICFVDMARTASNTTCLTTSALGSDPALDRDPAWSPDGVKIAFSSDRDGNSVIYVMDANGSGEQPLTQNRSFSYGQPCWSPDGQYIAFTAGNDIYVMKVDGSGPTRLAEGKSPAWAP